MKKSSILILLLVAAGLVLNFAFSGHDFLAYTLYLIAFLILLFRLVGKTARRLISLLLILGIGYFVFLELPIIQASSGDGDFEVQYVIVLGAAVKGETPSCAHRTTRRRSRLSECTPRLLRRRVRRSGQR